MISIFFHNVKKTHLVKKIYSFILSINIYRTIWNWQSPGRVRAFLWRALHGEY